MTEEECSALGSLARALGLGFECVCNVHGCSCHLEMGWSFDEFDDAVAFLCPSLSTKENLIDGDGGSRNAPDQGLLPIFGSVSVTMKTNR